MALRLTPDSEAPFTKTYIQSNHLEAGASVPTKAAQKGTPAPVKEVPKQTKKKAKAAKPAPKKAKAAKPAKAAKAAKPAKKKPKGKKPKTIRKTKALVEKAHKIHEQLETFYPETPIPLDHKDPYTLLVAVLLSAQCKDERVNQITPKLFAMADNPQDMIKCSVEDIADIIRPCGLVARKSKAIWDLSKIILDEHGGEVPADMEALEALPGVGHKTASVVMTQAFDVPAFPVDTHIHRLARRWGLSSGRNVEQTEADLKTLFPKEYWGKVHLQFIFFGREYCPARGHDPKTCPICNWGGVAE